MKKYSIELKWAVFFALMMVAWMLLERLLGLHGPNIEKHAVFTNLVSIPAIAFCVFALLEKRKSLPGGAMTYGQGVAAGLVMTLGVTLLSPLTQWLAVGVISPDFFPNMVRFAVEQGSMAREEAEAFFNLRSYMRQTVLFTPAMGVATTLLVALFTPRKPAA